MNYRTIYHSDKEELVKLFVGKSVKKVSDYTLELSDGTVLEIEGNYGCGGCSAGNYDLEELNDCENIITNVEVEVSEDDAVDWYDVDVTYHLFVYSGHTKINLATIQGTDGNGYYGTGFWIKVKEAK